MLDDHVQADHQDSFWYKSAVIYEVHVRAFCDANGDGIGDFLGLTEKLGYIQDLGVTAIWLLPFYPSPLKDDGYDIADYYSINPMYGTLSEFEALLREAHARGLRVITELVLNHTSDQHPWFQRSRRARPGSVERDFYVWSDSPEKYKDARIIFKDFEPSNWAWDPLARAYYWHRFYSHQPDLNFDNPAVHEEVRKVLDFWFDMGVDGLRLDAVPYLYEREGTSCENLGETHQFLKQLRAHIDRKYGDRMLLAEANQWPEEAVSYFGAGAGDEAHMAFHFPLMPRLFMSVRMEDRVPIVDILEQTPSIPETSQWALFLRNHDELTLEMVTDEERDYMYRVYASDVKARINLGIRRRLAPLLGNDRKRIELLNLLLFSLPGTPVLYYGDEIGMGDNVFLGDRNAVRTPMQWSADKNAGFSRTSPQALYLPITLDPEYHYEAINVETQQHNPHSLLWWMKRVLALRKRWKAFGLGTLEFLQPENRKVLAFVRRYQEETLLVIANLSRFPQPVELDLKAFAGRVPVELFGRTHFPLIAEAPYFLTLGPHAALWFSLEPAARPDSPAASGGLCQTLKVSRDWEELFLGKGKAALEACLPTYLRERRWFGGKSREIKSAQIREMLRLPFDGGKALIAIAVVDYMQGDPEDYLLPLAFASGAVAEQIERETPHLLLSRIQAKAPNDSGVLYDAFADKGFCRALLGLIARGQSLKGTQGELASFATASSAGDMAGVENLEPSVSRAEQSNTSVVFGDKLIFKLFRRLEHGVNPDEEIGRFLTARRFTHVPPVAGGLEYRRNGADVQTVGILSGFIPNAKDAWTFTLDALGRYFERVRTYSEPPRPDLMTGDSILDLAERDIPQDAANIVGTYLESARLLGQRTGEMHLELGSDAENKNFAPEPFTPFYQRSLYQSLRNLLNRNFHLLGRNAKTLPESARSLAERVLASQEEVLKRYRAVNATPLSAMRIRCHGDFHLGQVLYTGKDFVIIDFEGEPARPIGERRIKRSPLLDVASMIRSFDYVAFVALSHELELGRMQKEQFAACEAWMKFWHRWAGAVFLKAYLSAVANSNLLPKTRTGLVVMFEALLLDKAVYEIGYELNNRPNWLHVPLQGILQLVQPVNTV